MVLNDFDENNQSNKKSSTLRLPTKYQFWYPWVRFFDTSNLETRGNRGAQTLTLIWECSERGFHCRSSRVRRSFARPRQSTGTLAQLLRPIVVCCCCCCCSCSCSSSSSSAWQDAEATHQGRGSREGQAEALVGRGTPRWQEWHTNGRNSAAS